MGGVVAQQCEVIVHFIGICPPMGKGNKNINDFAIDGP